MKAKSIKGRSTEEVKTSLEQSMTDGYKPTLAICFISKSQDKNAISELLDAAGIAIFVCTTNGEFIDEVTEKGSAAILLLEQLNNASGTLAMAFSQACENSKSVNVNTTNFRLHELMLQLIALNTGIPVTDKWQVFNSKIKKPAALRKRQQWMATETNFNERVKYILDRQNDYMTRLAERARKYSFT